MLLRREHGHGRRGTEAGPVAHGQRFALGAGDARESARRGKLCFVRRRLAFPEVLRQNGFEKVAARRRRALRPYGGGGSDAISGAPAAPPTAERTAWYTASKTARSLTNFTSVLAGCTFTSSREKGSERCSTQAGNFPTMRAFL
jgi:hypothetical protein